MDTYFEYKHSFRSVDFHYTRKPTVDEREIHHYHEILYYIGGDATLLCEGFSKRLTPYSLILIPKGSYHFFKCADRDRFERLKISFTDINGFTELAFNVMSEIRIFEELDKNTVALLDSICAKIKAGEGDTKSAFLSGALLILLSTLENGIISVSPTTRYRLITDTVNYIDRNLCDRLDMERVAQAMNVSSSTLSHTFKREMGISLHQYVTEKRMIFAQRLLSDGALPTKIFTDCGFSDYSSFYKAYLKHFGRPPSGRDL